jgi:hypothetical protein
MTWIDVMQDRSIMDKRPRQYRMRLPKIEGIWNINNNIVHMPFLVNESPSHGMTMNRYAVCIFNKLQYIGWLCKH